MRYCLAPHCPEMVEGRVAYCPTHAPQKVWVKKERTGASGWAWSRIRRRVLSLANYSCEVPGCGRPATEVDHVVPRAEGGTDDLENLRALCIGCHASKSEDERLRGLKRRST